MQLSTNCGLDNFITVKKISFYLHQKFILQLVNNCTYSTIAFSCIKSSLAELNVQFHFFVPCPPLGLLPVLEPLGGDTDATHLLCPALRCGSRAGVILGRTSGSEVDASPV